MKNDVTTASLRYQRGISYNEKLDYYGEVSENIDYLADKQWGADMAKGSMPNPVFNIEKMIQRYKVSSVISPSISAKYSVDAVDEDVLEGEDKILSDMAKLLSNSASVRWERNKMMSILRKCVEDAWVSGDMCTHTYWDADKKTNQGYKGDFCTERISGGNVFFGNPKSNKVKDQPYILIIKQENVGKVRKRAKSYKLDNNDIMKIVPNDNTDIQMGELFDTNIDGASDIDRICDVYLTYYIEDGIVYLDEETSAVELKMKTKIKEGQYPITWGNWDEQENSYHGRSESSGLHTTQRFINKMYALCMLWMINNAFGKIVYDETRCSGVTNEIGVAIPISGPVTEVIAQLKSGDFNTAILQVIDTAIEYTKEFCGLSNAALGQGAAYNTSAIVALGKQAAIQLEGNQARVFQFVEDIYSIWADFMVEKYGNGRKMPVMEEGKLVYKPFDNTMKEKMILNTRIDVGASSVWNEIAAIQTLDNMLMNAVLTPIQYIERLPAGVMPNREGLIQELKAVAQMPTEEEQAQPEPNMMGEDDNEVMAQFFDSLPQEQQTALKSLPADQMEQAVISMMSQGGQNGVQGRNEEEIDLESMMSQLGGQ
jgi:hypothetical protein